MKSSCYSLDKERKNKTCFMVLYFLPNKTTIYNLLTTCPLNRCSLPVYSVLAKNLFIHHLPSIAGVSFFPMLSQLHRQSGISLFLIFTDKLCLFKTYGIFTFFGHNHSPQICVPITFVCIFSLYLPYHCDICIGVIISLKRMVR